MAANSASQYLDLLTENETARAAESEKESEKAAADAQAAARADIDADLLEIERLKAQKDLKELRTELGISGE